LTNDVTLPNRDFNIHLIVFSSTEKGFHIRKPYKLLLLLFLGRG